MYVSAFPQTKKLYIWTTWQSLLPEKNESVKENEGFYLTQTQGVLFNSSFQTIQEVKHYLSSFLWWFYFSKKIVDDQFKYS